MIFNKAPFLKTLPVWICSPYVWITPGFFETFVSSRNGHQLPGVFFPPVDHSKREATSFSTQISKKEGFCKWLLQVTPLLTSESCRSAEERALLITLVGGSEVRWDVIGICLFGHLPHWSKKAKPQGYLAKIRCDNQEEYKT